MDPAGAVRRTRRHFDGGPRDINSGRCGEFASALVGPRGPIDGVLAETGETAARAGGAAHTWVVFRGRHYDAEAPEGAADWRDLPFFRRSWSEGERCSVGLVYDEDRGWYALEPGAKDDVR